jgi:hypothetical protein
MEQMGSLLPQYVSLTEYVASWMCVSACAHTAATGTVRCPTMVEAILRRFSSSFFEPFGYFIHDRLKFLFDVFFRQWFTCTITVIDVILTIVYKKV